MSDDQPEDLPDRLLSAVALHRTPQRPAVVSGRGPTDRCLEIRPFAFGPQCQPSPGGPTDLAVISRAIAEAMALSGAGLPPPLVTPGPSAAVRPAVGLFDLLDLQELRAAPGDPAAASAPRPGPDRLRVPIGVMPDGQPLVLDLKEPAEGGMGPHGLVVGATGSGKSELLRTLVAALALTHAPEELSFVFVDFKGGATFADLAGLAHCAGMITNLQHDLTLLHRMQQALSGEQRRRQELLRTAGNLASARDYQGRRSQGARLEPLPALLVVVDEFAELLTAKPEFIDVFTSIGRVGRSLGMHLLLASQRLDETRLRGLDSHISYRIALRTFNAADSRSVLGVADACHLPPEPGNAYLQLNSSDLRRFKSAMVPDPSRLNDLLPCDRPVHQVWVPPLGRAQTLDRVLEESRRYLGKPLRVAVGTVDRPLEQRQHPLVLDLVGDRGNLAVVGAPQTGKSTFLQTLVLGLCLTRTPEQLHIYVVDYGGGGLVTAEMAPHVGGVATRSEPEKSCQVVREVEAVVAARDGFAPGERPHVFLIIDNWPAFRLACEDLEPVITDIAARGLGVGVHVAVSANRWLDLRAGLRDSLGTRLELRMNDPSDSILDRRQAADLPVGVPGRGITSEALQFQAALPCNESQTTEELFRQLLSEWTGPPAPAIRLLPPLVTFADMPPPGQDGQPGVPIGLGEGDLHPVHADLSGPDPHFLVLGDAESGKTTFLRTFLVGLTARVPPDLATVVVVDPRRTLVEAVHEDHVLGYAASAPAAAREVSGVYGLLSARLPSHDVTMAQLRDRSWWEGPDVYVVVDDYDMLATTSGSPLAPLAELLPYGRDIGLHLVLARRVAGFSRAVFEPVLQRARELGTPGLLLSGDRQEGPLIGAHRAVEQPPGRGLLVRPKRAPVLVQVAWAPP